MRKKLILVSALAVSGAAFSQTDTTGVKTIDEVELTVAAKKYADKKSEDVGKMPIKNLDNPQVYTILPKELMAEQLATDYQNALQMAPGIGNINYGPASGGIGLWAYSRGFSTFAGAIRNGAGTNYGVIADPFNTENLEVIKGPSGTLFGATLINYGGLINRVTKKPYDRFGGEISYTTGNWNMNRLTADANIPINDNLKSRFNALYQTEGSFQDAGHNKSFGFAPSFSYKVSDRFTINMDAEIYQTDRNATYIGLGQKITAKKFSELNLDPKYSYASNDILSHVKSFSVFVTGVYKISDKWTSNTVFSMANADNEANYLFLNINGDRTVTRFFMKIPSLFDAVDIQQNFVGNLTSGKIKHQVLFGAEYSRNASDDHRYMIYPYDIIPVNQTAPEVSQQDYDDKLDKKPYFSSKKDFRTTAIYVSDLIEFTPYLKALLSVRADFHKETGTWNFKQNYFSPKVGLVYQPIKDVLSIFANYMNGFKNTPPGTDTVTKQDIAYKPEHAEQYEAGIKAELLNKKVAGTVSFYNIHVKDVVRPDPNIPLASIQDGERLSRGFEADVITNPISGLEVILGYGYNDSKYTKAAANVEGKRPYSVPKHIGNFWASYRFPTGDLRGLGFGIGGNFLGDSVMSDYSDLIVDSYAKFDASVFYEHPKFRLGLKLNNFTNKHYFTSDYWGNFANPRQFLANLTFKF